MTSSPRVNDIASDIVRDARSYSRNHSPTKLQQQAFCLNGQRSVTAWWRDDSAMVNMRELTELSDSKLNNANKQPSDLVSLVVSCWHFNKLITKPLLTYIYDGPCLRGMVCYGVVWNGDKWVKWARWLSRSNTPVAPMVPIVLWRPLSLKDPCMVLYALHTMQYGTIATYDFFSLTRTALINRKFLTIFLV